MNLPEASHMHLQRMTLWGSRLAVFGALASVILTVVQAFDPARDRPLWELALKAVSALCIAAMAWLLRDPRSLSPAQLRWLTILMWLGAACVLALLYIDLCVRGACVVV